VCATDLGATSGASEIVYRKADITKPEELKPVLENSTTVIHVAGLAHIFSSDANSVEKFRQINEIGTANVAAAAAAAGVGHLILISSVSVYGPYTQGVYDENTPCNPVGPYALSKYNAELRAIEITRESGMALTILRLATLYGEGDPGNVGRLMRAIDRGRFIWIGSGANQKSLIHREDVARACLAVLQNTPDGINIYNVSAPPCTMREVVEGLALALGRKIPPWHVPAPLALRIGSICKSFSRGRGTLGNLYDTIRKWLEEDVYDTSKFDKTFNFKTKVGLTEGLNREVDWYRSDQRRHLG
jgi:nucleoside-diphosphate-sugar epimerase